MDRSNDTPRGVICLLWKIENRAAQTTGLRLATGRRGVRRKWRSGSVPRALCRAGRRQSTTIRARHVSTESSVSNRSVRTLPVLTWVKSAHRVPLACSIHADVIRHLVPLAAAVTWTVHALTALACARAAVARCLRADLSSALFERKGDGDSLMAWDPTGCES
jgi:hypothetical protein